VTAGITCASRIVTGRKEHVMMDIAGPGAIVRIWSANPAGTLRIYLDGAATPPSSRRCPTSWRQVSRSAAADCRRVQQGLEPVPADPLRQALQSDQRHGQLLLPRQLPHLSAGHGRRNVPRRAACALKAELEAVMSRMNAPGDAPRAAGADCQPFDLQIVAGQSATLAR